MQISQMEKDKNFGTLKALSLMLGAITRDIYKYVNPVLSRNKPRYIKEKRESTMLARNKHSVARLDLMKRAQIQRHDPSDYRERRDHCKSH